VRLRGQDGGAEHTIEEKKEACDLPTAVGGKSGVMADISMATGGRAIDLFEKEGPKGEKTFQVYHGGGGRGKTEKKGFQG